MVKFGKLLLPSVLLFGAILLVHQTQAAWPDGTVSVLFALAAAVIMALTYGLLNERRQRRQAGSQEGLYRETFERTTIGIAHVTEDGHWIRANPAFLEMLGYPREELVRMTFQELTHPDDVVKDSALAHQVWTRRIPTYTLEKRYIRKDGSILWGLLSVALSTSESGEPKYFIANVLDITARKKAEAALMESNLQLHLAMEAAQLGSWEYEVAAARARGHGRLWSDLDLGNEQQVFVGFKFLKRIHPDDRQRVRAQFKEAMDARTPYSCEFRLLMPDGQDIWLESTGSPLLDEQGQVIRMVGVTRVITDRKLAQIDFQRSVDASPAILWITEPDGSCSFLSEQWYAFTGQTAGEALGYGWLNAVHDEDREAAREAFLSANASRTGFYCEYRLRTGEGEYRWTIDAGHPRLDTDGTYLGFAGTIFDIHDRKLAQSRLEATARQLKAWANSIPQMAWTAGPDGEMTWFNERWLHYTGRNLEAMVKDGWMSFLHPNHRDRVEKRFQQSLNTGEIWEDTFPLRSASGAWRWFLSRAYPVRHASGSIEQWFGTNTDITELRAFQQALVESETSFRELANSMPQLVWSATAEGRVDYYNDRAAEYDGFYRNDDGHWNWQPGLHPDDLNETVHSWHEAVRKGRVYACEHRVRMLDGTYRWHLSRAQPVVHEDGTLKKWYGTATDIHEYKLALVELARAKESAEEASQAKSRFLANMSHEIRSPMSSVLGYADLLLERGLPDSERLAYAASIKASGGHLLAIIDDILDLSAVEAGEFKIDRHAFAVVDLVAESVQSMSILAEKKGLDLQVIFETPVPEVIESDPLRFRQILLNLLSNAIKFTDAGRIVIRLGYQDHVLRLEVEDSGSGIDASKTDRLFQAFSQIDSGISRKHGGTGLGLHLSRRLAQALSGDLRLDWSVPGCGSAFVLELGSRAPANVVWIQSLQEIKRTKARAHTLASPSAQTCRVLLAEDSADNQILIKIFLKKLGAHVDLACNGEEAIQMALEGQYDIILMDMMMPVMDGLEATRRLRALGYQKPIAALTAHALKEEVEKSLLAGCDLHLSKPLQLDVLGRALELLLHGRRDEAPWGGAAHH